MRGRADGRVEPQEEPTTAPGETRSRPSLPRLGYILAIGSVVLVLDQATKWWAVDRLVRGPIHVIGSLRFNLAYNTGTAFSIGRSKDVGPVIALLAVVVIVLFLLSGGLVRRASGALAAGLVIGGALGNLADRAFRGDAGFLHGAVVDFIDLQWWPVFNVADAAIVVGALLALVANLRQ